MDSSLDPSTEQIQRDVTAPPRSPDVRQSRCARPRQADCKPLAFRVSRRSVRSQSAFALWWVAFAFACGGEPPFVAPEPPPIGFQIRLKPVVIQPGQDLEYCTYFNLDMPEELSAENRPLLVEDLIANGIDAAAPELAVGRIDVRGATGLHHIQILELGKDVEDVENKHIFECAVDLFGGPLTGDVEPLFFTALNDYSVTYEPGVARILTRVADRDQVRTASIAGTATATKTRGTQLLYNFHYLNVTEEPITAEAVVNLHVVPRETVVHPVRSAWWNYVYFKVLPEGTSAVQAEGSFNVDVNLVSMTSHQHQLGTSFAYRRASGEEVYRNTSWSEPSYLTLPKDTVIRAQEPIRFDCEWNNPTTASRFFGLQADDEMCTAILEYYPVDEAGAAAFLEQRRREAEQASSPFEADPISLERFLGMPDQVLEDIALHPEEAEQIIDRDIMCGIAINLKEMEQKYGSAPDVLGSLQVVLDYLSPLCRL